MEPINGKVIDVSTPFKSFYDHLDQKENKNIVFSAPFGEGKSFFIDYFFKRTEVKIKYDAIIISPVNYAISKNEQIFDLMKIDIFFNLVLKGYLDGNEIIGSKFENIKELIRAKGLNLIPFLTAASAGLTIDPKVASVALATGTISQALDKFSNEFMNIVNDKKNKSVVKYINTFIQERNTYLENNFITEVIHEALSNSKKEVVLVIDDMDRLDAEHLFRIFNVFSAQYSFNGDHKLGFSKVVFVCDMDNAERIYKYKNGPDARFDGYFDKFYSLLPFEFNNRQSILEFLAKKFSIDANSHIEDILNTIVSLLYNSNKITLRSLVALEKFDLELNIITPRPKYISVGHNCIIENKYVKEALSWKWVIPLFGSMQGFYDSINSQSFMLSYPESKFYALCRIYSFFEISSTVANQLNSFADARSSNESIMPFIYDDNTIRMVIEIEYKKIENKILIMNMIIKETSANSKNLKHILTKFLINYIKTIQTKAL